jgi:hypothetical protein
MLTAACTAQTTIVNSGCLSCGPAPAPRVYSKAYKQLIEPLLTVQDFHTHYIDDGAADATVTCPNDCDDSPSSLPVPAVAALMKNHSVTVPLLIDCLSDGRLTSIQFDGNATTLPMKVPVGYVCLDILISQFTYKPITDHGCSNDGLGACIYTFFYFRPDDYTHCWKDSCNPRPWVLVVQRSWRKQLQLGSLNHVRPWKH